MRRRLLTGIIISVLFLASCLFVFGCSPSRCVFPEDVIRKYQKINIHDGVNEKEAILIAQYEFIKRNIQNYFLEVMNKVKVKDENTWLVTFQSYQDGPESGQALDVGVDKRTGDITYWNKRPLVIKEGKIENHGLFVTQKVGAE